MEESNRQPALKKPFGLLSPFGHSFSNKDWIFISLLLVVSLLLRITHFHESLWRDELFSTKMRLENLSLFIETLKLTSQPPFYYVFMFGWIKIFGDSEISIRIPPLILGIGSILLTYIIALKYTERKTAVITALLLCFSPVHIWYSQEARPYMGILFSLLLAIYSFHKIKEDGAGPVWYYVYFGALFAAVFSHYYVILILICFSFFSFLKIKANKWARKILVGNSIIFVCFCLFTALKMTLGTVHSWLPHVGKIAVGLPHLRSFTVFELWKLFFNWFLLGNSLWGENISGSLDKINIIWKTPFVLSTNIFFFVLFVRGLILMFRQSDSSFGRDIICLLFAMPLFLMGLTLIGLKHIYIERSLLLILPLFYLVLAKGTLFKTRYTEILCTSVVLLFSVAALYGFFSKSDVRTVYMQKSDWRSVAHYLDSERKEAKEPLFVFLHDQSNSLFYYLKRQKIDPYQIRFTFYHPENFYATLAENDIKTFYCVKSEYWEEPNVKEILKMINQDFRFLLVDKKNYKAVEVYKFDFVKMK